MSDKAPGDVLSRTMRWAQLTLAENDPGRFDPDFWLDYFRRVRADGACLSAGGCVAYYPTDVPLHYRSRWLGGGDPFGYLVEGCRRMGMAILARTDPHACHQDVYEAHPDWIAVDAQGRPRRHWSHPDYWVTCTLSPYAFEFMTQVTREIAARYRVDGVFCNRWMGSGLCYCGHCRVNFKAATGLDLPSGDDDPAHAAYARWREERLLSLWDLWEREMQAAHPPCRFVPNIGGGATSELDMPTVAARAPMLVADRQGRSGLTCVWANGKNAKEYRAALGEKAVAGLFSVGIEEPHRWKDSVQSEAELRLWVVEGIAHGMRPWFSKFCGTIHDPRWLGAVERVFTWAARHEARLRDRTSLARVGLVYSQQTARHYGLGQAQQRTEDPIRGMYHALVEARIGFDMVHDGLMGATDINRYKLLILPNIACLSDEQCEQLRRFVGRGGSILATFETSLYDERGRPRADLGLADLLGVSLDGSVEGPMRNAYLQLRHPHPVLAGLEEAPRIIHGVRRLRVRPVATDFVGSPVTLIAAYPDLPMEEVYPRVESSDIRELYLRQQGRGRVAYFNWDVDRTFWEVLSADHGKLLANTVRWALDEEQAVSVTGAGVMDVSVWRQEDAIVVHLVNLTNPMMMKGPCRDLLPSGPQEVRVRLPAGTDARVVRLLVAERQRPAQAVDGVVAIRVPSVRDHEVVVVELAAPTPPRPG
jgi:hypothetical protein